MQIVHFSIHILNSVGTPFGLNHSTMLCSLISLSEFISETWHTTWGCTLQWWIGWVKIFITTDYVIFTYGCMTGRYFLPLYITEWECGPGDYQWEASGWHEETQSPHSNENQKVKDRQFPLGCLEEMVFKCPRIWRHFTHPSGWGVSTWVSRSILDYINLCE